MGTGLPALALRWGSGAGLGKAARRCFAARTWARSPHTKCHSPGHFFVFDLLMKKAQFQCQTSGNPLLAYDITSIAANLPRSFSSGCFPCGVSTAKAMSRWDASSLFFEIFHLIPLSKTCRQLQLKSSCIFPCDCFAWYHGEYSYQVGTW